MLTPADMPPGYVLVVSTATDVRIEDAADPDLFIEAGVLADGVLSFKIEAERNDGSRGSVRGKVLFDLVMRHFGASVTAVKGSWRWGSTNLTIFNKLTAAGLSPEQAACGTWTGEQADRHGFKTATKVQTLGAGPGYYGLAEFLFNR